MVEAFLDPVVVDERHAGLRGDRRRSARAGTSSATEHTQTRYKTAFHKPMLSDWRNYETWEEAGSPQVPEKANRIWKELLASYEPPPMDPASPRSSRRSSPGASPRAASRPTTERRSSPLKSETQVVVIGGGVVGASVLYHLTKAGWTDVMLLERRELTAGSTWHAAGGMHTLNGDPNVARLQQYTIQLYEEIERVSGQDCSIHLPGGLMLADTEVRMDFLRMAVGARPVSRHGPGAHLAQGSPGRVPAAGPAVLRRGAVRPGRGPRRPVRGHPRVREVRPDGRRRGPPAHARSSGWSSEPTAPGTSASRAATPSTPSTSSTPAACGRARSAGWSASSCRSSRWSTCTC